MAIKSIITNADGEKVTIKAGRMYVSQETPVAPDAGTQNIQQFYTAVLGSTGANSGTTNQAVDGSTTSREFYISAHTDYDIHIMMISVILADAAVTHNNFGQVSTLTNGWDLLIRESGVDTYIIQKAQTGGEVIAQSGFSNPFGNTSSTFELTNWTGIDDATIISIPLKDWIPNGLRIGRGTNDKLKSVVNDDLSTLTELTVRVFGYKNIPV